MRLFLGIELPAENKKELYKSLEQLMLKHPEFLWIQPANYHITLHFFGDVVQPKEVARRLEDILYDAESFYLYTFKMDIFVKKHLLLHLLLHRQKKMEELVKTVRTDLGSDEKSFLPHITLSKSSLSSKQQYYALNNEIEKLKIELEIKVDKVFLMESIITGKQPIYNKIAEFKLIKP